MSFTAEVINWYLENKRDLPWRNTTDPYIIWLSEVILQQTRVEQGLPYFNRFVFHYPTVTDFAAASEDEILRLWQGLGYYSRARNMHKAAHMVVHGFGGIFPSSYKTLKLLKGIGEYTAAAVASFAANENVAVVDGNVYRVLSRFFGIDIPINSPKGKKVFNTIAQDLIDPQHPATYNQAIMEFGALQCKPKSPNCAICPLQTDCAALKNNLISTLPVKIKGNKSRDRFFYYFIVQQGEEIIMNKRGPKDIWENLYEFPLIETTTPISIEEVSTLTDFTNMFGNSAVARIIRVSKKHILSHQNIYATFVKIDNTSLFREKKSAWNYVLLKDLDTLAKPKLIFAFIRDYLRDN